MRTLAPFLGLIVVCVAGVFLSTPSRPKPVEPIKAEAPAPPPISTLPGPAPAPFVNRHPAPNPALKPEDCKDLQHCAPGCYNGPRYCMGVCTANVGKSSCFEDCPHDNLVCALPDYDPDKAYMGHVHEQVEQEERNKHRSPNSDAEELRRRALLKKP